MRESPTFDVASQATREDVIARSPRRGNPSSVFDSGIKAWIATGQPLAMTSKSMDCHNGSQTTSENMAVYDKRGKNEDCRQVYYE